LEVRAELYNVTDAAAQAVSARPSRAKTTTVDAPVDRDGPVIISDRLAVGWTSANVVRLVCLAWLGPAVSMIWIGFGQLGLRPADAAGLADSLDRVQAAAMMLTIFGTLLGLIWALRTWSYLPSVTRVALVDGRLGVTSHLLAGAVAGVSR
jgi:hypothetical protein